MTCTTLRRAMPWAAALALLLGSPAMPQAHAADDALAALLDTCGGRPKYGASGQIYLWQSGGC